MSTEFQEGKGAMSVSIIRQLTIRISFEEFSKFTIQMLKDLKAQKYLAVRIKLTITILNNSTCCHLLGFKRKKGVAESIH